MRAAIVTPHLADPPVSVADWPDPTVPTGWVLVRVIRAALNRNDALWLEARDELPRPSVIGSDAAGVVAAVGDEVHGVSVGDEVIVLPSLWWGDREDAPGTGFQVLGFPTQGTHAELVAVPAENVSARPSRLSWEQAAALPLAAVTAWRALVTRGGLRSGETVVVTAASSGVGTYLVQIAAALGAHVVAVTSSAAKLETATRLGAADGVLRGPRLDEELRRVVGADADLVVDSTGAEWPVLVGALRRGGRLVSLGRTAAAQATVDVNDLFWRQISLLGTSMGSPRDFAALLEHVDQSTWVPMVEETLPLEDIRTAYERLDDPARVGKVVLAIS